MFVSDPAKEVSADEDIEAADAAVIGDPVNAVSAQRDREVADAMFVSCFTMTVSADGGVQGHAVADVAAPTAA